MLAIFAPIGAVFFSFGSFFGLGRTYFMVGAFFFAKIGKM
jgi:hypothetical protein